VEGADVFLGVSAGGLLKPEMLKKMNDNPLVFACANPTPEILYVRVTFLFILSYLFRELQREHALML